MMADVYLGINIPATVLAVRNKLLEVIGDVDIGPRPATLPPIKQVTMIYCCLYLFILFVLIILFMKIK